MNNKRLKNLIISIFIISIIFTSTFIGSIILEKAIETTTVKAESTWIQTTDEDFKNGTLNDLEIIGSGSIAELRLGYYSSASWKNKTPVNSPPARSFHAVSQIYGTDKIMLFGGYNIKEDFADTWVYDLSENKWTNKTPEFSPEKRRLHAMASIQGTDKIVMFGGCWSPKNDTWIYDFSENTWLKKTLNNSPSPRYGHAMAAINGTDKVILFGGFDSDDFFEETWIYDLSDNYWTRKAPKCAPYCRAFHSMTSIFNTDKVVSIGDYAECPRGNQGYNYENWIYDFSENNWIVKYSMDGPNYYINSAMASIHGTDIHVFFGGYDNSDQYSNETWLYDYNDNIWTNITKPLKPSKRGGHAMASVDGISTTVLFGGNNYDTDEVFGDTWVFNLKSLPQGEFISQPYDTKYNSIFKMLMWSADIPESTSIKFQLRTGTTESELQSKDFIGPDGTPSTSYIAPGKIWVGHNDDRWIQLRVNMATTYLSEVPVLKKVSIKYNVYPKLTSSLVNPITGNITQQFNFTVIYTDYDNDTPKCIGVSIDGIIYTMKGSNNEDNKFIDGKKYWFATKLSAGNHSYYFIASDGELNCSTNISDIKVDFGPLAQIIIEPSSPTITTDEYLEFSAKGYDADNNLLSITPTWEVSGGGIIDQTGNFTATTPGNWTVYANSSGISGNTTINILHGKLNQIIITPQLTTITTDEFQLFTATGFDADMNIVKISPKWAVTGGGAIDQTGNFTATTPGKWTIYANSSGISGNATITVTIGKLQKIIITPESPKIAVDDYQIFTAKGFDADNNIISISPTWEVNGGGVIDQTGNFTAIKAGIWIVYANESGVSGNTSIIVTMVKNSNQKDSDNDGIPDEWEQIHGLNAMDPTDAYLDLDNDKLTNLEEYLNNTDPNEPDSDDDNVIDGDEIEKDTDPLDNEDYPREERKKTQVSDNEMLILLIIILIIIVIIIVQLLIRKFVNNLKNSRPPTEDSTEEE